MLSWGQFYPEKVIHQSWNASQEPVHLGKVKKLEKFKTNPTNKQKSPPKQL